MTRARVMVFIAPTDIHKEIACTSGLEPARGKVDS
jgi:hypothetical protein